MSNELRDQTAQIIRSIMEQQGWSASQTAREAGLSPSTLTRALDEDSPFTPSSATLQKLMQLALKMRNESADEYWSTLDDVSRTATRLALVTGEPIPVAGAVEWGAWRDTLLQKPQTGRSISLFDSSWLSKSIAIYEVADDVSDPSYKAGSFLVVGSHKEETIYDQDVFLCRRIVSFSVGPSTSCLFGSTARLRRGRGESWYAEPFQPKISTRMQQGMRKKPTDISSKFWA